MLLAVAATLAVLLAALSRRVAAAGRRARTGRRWLPLHWLLGVVSYGLFGVAVLHAWLLDGAERRLRTAGAAPSQPAGGVPLLQLERLTFRFVEAGFVVLSTALAAGRAAGRALALGPQDRVVAAGLGHVRGC